MNLFLLLAALLPWASTPVALFTRVFVAVSLLSLEMQVATLAGGPTLPVLVAVNAPLAVLLVLWQWRRSGPPGAPGMAAAWRVAPWPAWLALGGLVLVLNVAMPLEAADPYHFERVAQIERLGTLAHDPAAEPKVNILGWLYELLLADVRQVPLLGAALVKLHGVFGLLLYGVALGAAHTWLRPAAPAWTGAVLLVVPPAFHQLVLVKNDFFLALPAFVALVWLVTGARDASWRATAWAGWLAGLSVAGKLTNAPVAVVLAVGVAALAWRRRDWRPAGGLGLGGLIGGLTGGLGFTLLQNARWYGDVLARAQVAEIDSRTASLAHAFESLGRLAISLVDLGQLTGQWWPGRGGWGGTFGLPFIWAVAVLAVRYRSAREARWTVWIVAFHLAAFGAVFPDADLSHRLALVPALLAISVALALVSRGGPYASAARLALVPVVLLSGAQIARSAVLYWFRS